MTQLVWDKIGDRRYETGLDRGVLYLTDGRVISWNGLVEVAESTSREIKSYYLDGVRYLVSQTPGAYSANLQAFTYPDELDDLLGVREFAPGVRMHDQPSKRFNFSYRTLIGNDVEGTDYGYRIHIVYNVVATQNDFAYGTLSNEATAQPFQWTLTGVPEVVFGIRPTAHISIDSRQVSSEVLTRVEKSLYGDSTSDPSLPNLINLLAQVENA